MEPVTDSPQVSHVTYKWNVKNFSSYQKNVGEYIESQKFSMFGDVVNQWCIRVYPFGYSESEKNSIAIYLAWDVAQKELIPASCTISTYNNKKTCLKKLVSIRSFKTKDVCGIRNIAERYEILPLKNDTLVIDCHINWKGNISKTLNLKAFEKSDGLNLLSSDFSNLMEKAFFNDYMLVSNDGTEFPVHKCVLASRSPGFAETLKIEENQKAVIEEFNKDIIKIILEFIYSGTFISSECKFFEIYNAADKYKIDGLKHLCELELCKSVSCKNVCDYLTFACEHNAKSLESNCFDFIAMHPKEILEMESFKNLKVKQPYIIEKIAVMVKEKNVSDTFKDEFNKLSLNP